MQIQDLGSLSAGTTIDTDLVIIGGGPAGLTIAREFFGTSTRVLLLESGRLKENPRFTNLAAVDSVGEPKGEAQARKRSSSTVPIPPLGRVIRKRSGCAVECWAARPTPGRANQPRLTTLTSPCGSGCRIQGGLSGLRRLIPISIALLKCSILAPIVMT